MAGVGNFWAAKIVSLTFSAFLQLTFPYIKIFLHFASALPITFHMVHALGMFLSLVQLLFNNCAIVRPTGHTAGRWCGNRKTTPFLILRKIANRIAEGAIKTANLKNENKSKNPSLKIWPDRNTETPGNIQEGQQLLKDLLWNDLFHSSPFLLGNWSCIDSSKCHQTNTW